MSVNYLPRALVFNKCKLKSFKLNYVFTQTCCILVCGHFSVKENKMFLSEEMELLKSSCYFFVMVLCMFEL